MPPVGLLAIVALGLVLAYALPQRARERAEYGMVRIEDRFSADMRVIRSSAARVERGTARRSTTRANSPLAIPKAARATITALGEATMSRPAAPLDHAATVARRQAVAMRRDRATVLRRRSQQARRRAVIGFLFLLGTGVTWGMAAQAAAPMWLAVTSTTFLGAVGIAGRRAVGAQARADARLVPVAREVVTAATAAEALQRVATGRAAGRQVAPSVEETQAIRVVTADDFAPGAVPAVLPAPELPERDVQPGWAPATMPVPAYTLKPEAKPKTARPITAEDLEVSQRAAERAVDLKASVERASEHHAPAEAEPSTATLNAILMRRRKHTA